MENWTEISLKSKRTQNLTQTHTLYSNDCTQTRFTHVYALHSGKIHTCTETVLLGFYPSAHLKVDTTVHWAIIKPAVPREHGFPPCPNGGQ